ncbi:hypothetical protein FA15DRAFT_326204 [Coprinopsis marcescibilis]|uniref:Nephrocystin 3-like N-terminal domain-containing protein n=1 Tax=Coprinopsis marcescibilis TaxID=230819 RepID=A0A5C3KZ88_COPMA|nr:hypothetical protein FA15DRAFT_326204 [Coprinopsis marcescibilis]
MVDNSYNIHTTNNGNYGLQLLRTNMASSALHNSRERFDPPKCDEDTRVGLLDEVSDWVKNRNADAPNTYILAMTGPAGSGKSALMQTLTERSAAVGILLASFFFSATDSRRNNKERFVATIAYQIAQSITAAREPITRAVELDPSIFDRTMETQIETLIVEPLKEVMTHSNGNWEKLPYSIFIDGIDECQGEEHQSHLLRVFEGLVLKSQLPLKLCFSSRPEFAVRSAISEDGHLTQTKLLYLIELSEHDARADIHRTLQRRLREIGKHSEDPRATSDTWPSQEDLDTLVENSSGQYIYAATVIKFLSDRRRSPVKRMEAILAWTPGMQQREKPFAVLDNLYTNIFMSALKAYRGEDAPDEDLTIIRSLHMIRLFTMQGYVTRVPDFEAFLKLDPGEVGLIISDLHSLIKTLHGDKLVRDALQIEFHHKSVPDFLQDRHRCGALYIAPAETYAELALACLEWIAKASEKELQELFQKQHEHSEPLFISLCFWAGYLHEALSDSSDANKAVALTIFPALGEFTASGSWRKLFTVICDVTGPGSKGHPFWVGNEMCTVTEWISPFGKILEICEKKGLMDNPTWGEALNGMQEFVTRLKKLREEWGKPMHMRSYRAL